MLQSSCNHPWILLIILAKEWHDIRLNSQYLNWGEIIQCSWPNFNSCLTGWHILVIVSGAVTVKVWWQPKYETSDSWLCIFIGNWKGLSKGRIMFLVCFIRKFQLKQIWFEKLRGFNPFWALLGYHIKERQENFSPPPLMTWFSITHNQS